MADKVSEGFMLELRKPMKKHLPLIIAIAIPLFMILFVAGSIYLPGLFVKPKYNFVYLSGTNYGEPYFVSANGQLQKDNTTSTYYPNGYPLDHAQIYFYDVANNQAKPISFDDAQKLSLDHSTESPDGFEITSGGGDGGMFPFFYESGDYSAEYLKGHNFSKKLNLQIQGSYYNDFTFLGWIAN
jgi:hypothetical protein